MHKNCCICNLPNTSTFWKNGGVVCGDCQKQKDNLFLSQKSIDILLSIIADFDRERGVPHDYIDLEIKLKEILFQINNDKLDIK